MILVVQRGHRDRGVRPRTEHLERRDAAGSVRERDLCEAAIELQQGDGRREATEDLPGAVQLAAPADDLVLAEVRAAGVAQVVQAQDAAAEERKLADACKSVFRWHAACPMVPARTSQQLVRARVRGASAQVRALAALCKWSVGVDR